MKKRNKALITLICALTMLLCAAWPVLAASDEVLVVGVPTDRCPIFYIDNSTDSITGIGVDLMRSAAQGAGYTPEFCPVGEETLKEAIYRTKVGR